MDAILGHVNPMLNKYSSWSILISNLRLPLPLVSTTGGAEENDWRFDGNHNINQIFVYSILKTMAIAKIMQQQTHITVT